MTIAANRNLRQDITYWAPNGRDGFGSVEFDPPVVLKGRWEEKQEEFHTLQGDLQTSNAIIYLRDDVEIEGFVYEGISDSNDPRSLEGAWPVRRFSSTPDLRNLARERKAFV